MDGPREGGTDRQTDGGREGRTDRQVERQRYRERVVGALQFTPHFHIPERVHTTFCCSCYIFAI